MIPAITGGVEDFILLDDGFALHVKAVVKAVLGAGAAGEGLRRAGQGLGGEGTERNRLIRQRTGRFGVRRITMLGKITALALAMLLSACSTAVAGLSGVPSQEATEEAGKRWVCTYRGDCLDPRTPTTYGDGHIVYKARYSTTDRDYHLIDIDCRTRQISIYYTNHQGGINALVDPLYEKSSEAYFCDKYWPGVAVVPQNP